MRSTAPAAVAASISCSRARLVALRRQVRAVPAVHMTIGPISATQSSRFRSAPRCRSPQHARRREVPSRSTGPTTSATSDPIAQLGMSRRAGLHLADDRTDLGAGPNRLTRSRAPGLMSMPSARMRPAAISPSWCTAAGGTPERDDDDSDGDLHGSRRHAAPASRSTIEHLGRRSRSISPVQAGVGVARLMTAGGAATSRVRSCFQSDGRRGDGNKSSIRQPK